MGKNIFILFCAIFISGLLNAQERGIPVYKDYLTDNLYLLHPSMAGIASRNEARLTARQMWFDVDDAPSLQTASVNGRLNRNIGLGTILYNDSNGRFSQQGAYFTFAYHLMFSRSEAYLNQLSFGVNLGVIQEKLDETDIDLINNPDPIIAGVEQQDNFFNVDVGVSYNYMDFFAHFTAKNIIPQDRQIFTEVFETDNQRQFIASSGYTFSVPGNNKLDLQPSVLLQYKDATEETNLDLNAKAYYELGNGRLWGGLSYRRSFDGAEFTAGGTNEVDSQKLQTLSPFLGYDFGRFLFAYTYTNQINSVVLTNSGFHQITLGFRFGESRARPKCNCPAVN
jgi:type IX secretion system PorP/SprF family membrane protein